MKTPEQLLSEWSIPPGTAVSCAADQLVPLIRAAMQAGVENAREQVFNDLEDGSSCPACTQFAKMYKRPLNRAMAQVLVIMHEYLKKHPEERYVHVEKLLKKLPVPSSFRGDWHKARHWGLIESDGETRADGSNRTGYWRLSDAGVQFVGGLSKVPSHALIYDDKLIRLVGNPVSVRDCLPPEFDYQKLMKGQL